MLVEIEWIGELFGAFVTYQLDLLFVSLQKEIFLIEYSLENCEDNSYLHVSVKAFFCLEHFLADLAFDNFNKA